jgi:DNA-binding PucR family transcriptional regulator
MRASMAETGPESSAVDDGRATSLAALERAAGGFPAAALARMHRSLPWYRAMPADARASVGLVVQAGVTAFVSWFRDPSQPPVTADVFGQAPRELARTITLQQTVELVRSTIAVVEEWADNLADVDLRARLREGVLTYSREIAFAAADVYAQAAEARGAWDARLEALLVDAIVRGDEPVSLASRAAALGWSAPPQVLVMAGRPPDGAIVGDQVLPTATVEAAVESLRRAARAADVDLLTNTYADHMVVVLGGGADLSMIATAMAGRFGPGAVVIGPVVDGLTGAQRSAAAALSGLRAAAAWPDAPRPVGADELLPERVLAGDESAHRQLVTDVYAPMLAADPAIVETVTVYLEQAGSLEGAARSLFVHPNTVRYRLRRVTEITGQLPTEPRGAYVLRIALSVGRLSRVAPSG